MRRRVDDLAPQIAAAARIELAAHLPAETGPWAHRLESDARIFLHTLLRAIADRRLLTPVELEVVSRFGSRQGTGVVPAHTLIRVQRVAERAVWGGIRAEGSKLPIDQRLILNRNLIDLQRALETQVQAALSQAALGVWGTALHEGTAWGGDGTERPTPLGELLDGNVEGFKATAREGAPSFPANPVFVVVVLKLAPGKQAPDMGLPQLASRVAESLDAAHQPAIAIRRGEAAIVVPVSRDNSNRTLAQKVEDVLETSDPARSLVAGVGRLAPGLQGAHASYVQGGRAVGFAGTTDDIPHVLTDEDALPLALLVRDPQLGLEVLQASIGPLRRAGRRFEVLLATLSAYVDTCGNMAETAKLLGIHRHTLSNRITRIESITGRKLDRAQDQLLLSLGLQAMKLFPTGMDKIPADEPADEPLPE